MEAPTTYMYFNLIYFLMNAVSSLQYAMHIISLIHVVFPNNKVLAHDVCSLVTLQWRFKKTSHVIHNNIKHYPHVVFQFISRDPKYSMSLLLKYIIYGISVIYTICKEGSYLMSDEQ